MGVKNYLIDGVSCAGKTTVCGELQRRGYHVIHGDDLFERWGEQLAQPSVGRQRELDLRASFTAGLGVAVAADRGVLLKPIGPTGCRAGWQRRD